MELRHLRYFVAVAEHKGYREAARHLHITQPALTQTISDLEAEVGTLLVDRRSRPLTLTRAGESYMVSARSILEDSDRALDLARRVGRGATGVLRVAFIPYATHHFLPQLLRQFKQRHPTVELDVRTLTPASQIAGLLNGSIDIGFTREPHPAQQSRLASLRLFDVPLVAIVPKDFPVAGPSVSPARLAEYEFILLPRKESPALFDSIILMCRNAGFSPLINSFPDLAESMMTLVDAGQGVAVLPLWIRPFAELKLRCLVLEPSTVRAELVAAWPAERLTRESEDFLAMVRENAEEIMSKTQKLKA